MDFCPNCGHQRVGAYRFCGSCGHDLGPREGAGQGASATAEVQPLVEAPPTLSQPRGRSRARALILLSLLGIAAVGLILVASGRVPSVGPRATAVNLATSPVEVTRQFWRAVGTDAVERFMAADFMAADYTMRSAWMSTISGPKAAPESISIIGRPVESGPVAFVTTEVCTSGGGDRV